MEYQVWTKDEYGELWAKVDCAGLDALKREIEKAIRAGKEPVLTAEIAYELDIKISEVESEAAQTDTGPGKGTRDESEGEVRPGAAAPVPDLG